MLGRDVIAAAHRESRKLVEVRDYLLPKLLSGEVRVRDAEQLAAEVV
jgi:type I restriction enzyme S subunit